MDNNENGTLTKYKVDENGHMYEEEVEISLPDPMDKANIYTGVCELLDITMEELNSNSKRIDDSNAYYYNSARGGKQVIVADDGSYLAAGSSINYDDLLAEFNSGRRNGNFNSKSETM